jgi:hypothetical protein
MKYLHWQNFIIKGRKFENLIVIIELENSKVVLLKPQLGQFFMVTL